jgi:hypothetical protein
MTFTDNDLKHMKELLTQMNSPTQMVNHLLKIGTLLPALFARMKAAEKLCDHVQKYFDSSDYGLRLFKVWRKAAGK